MEPRSRWLNPNQHSKSLQFFSVVIQGGIPREVVGGRKPFSGENRFRGETESIETALAHNLERRQSMWSDEAREGKLETWGLPVFPSILRTRLSEFYHTLEGAKTPGQLEMLPMSVGKGGRNTRGPISGPRFAHLPETMPTLCSRRTVETRLIKRHISRGNLPVILNPTKIN